MTRFHTDLNLTTKQMVALTALEGLIATARRNLIRTASSVMLDFAFNNAFPSPDDRMKEFFGLIKESDALADHDDARKKMTSSGLSGFVKYLSTDAMLYIIHAGLNGFVDMKLKDKEVGGRMRLIGLVTDLESAIHAAGANGVPSKKSKYGFSLGVHKDWNEITITQVSLFVKGFIDMVKAAEATSKPAPAKQPGSGIEINVDPESRQTMDKVLKHVTNNVLDTTGLESLITEAIDAKEQLSEAQSRIKMLTNQVTSKNSETQRLENELLSLKNSQKSAPVMPATIESKSVANTELPKGDMTYKMASDVFGIDHPALRFDIPVFKWEGDHPWVPSVNKFYKFRPQELARALKGLVNGLPAWIWGHTGAGKSVMVEQICAYTSWPMKVLNFDAEITRLDVVGREVLREKNGATVSEFVPGVLIQAMENPCILLCDEMDFVLEDVAYVLQTALNSNSLTITEDGGRQLIANPMFRVIATANTNGQRDETGIYRGARTQSSAFLSRFKNWIKTEYMDADEEVEVVAKQFAVSEDFKSKMQEYLEAHRRAFVSGEVMQPISQRDLTAMAAMYVEFMPLLDGDQAYKLAIDSAVLGRATASDYSVLQPIAQRVYGSVMNG